MTEYTIYSAPPYPKHSDIIEMESEELKRLCHDNHLPIFSLRVDNIINVFGFPENPKKPYTRLFSFAPGVWFIAKTEIEDTPQEAQ